MRKDRQTIFPQRDFKRLKNYCFMETALYTNKSQNENVMTLAPDKPHNVIQLFLPQAEHCDSRLLRYLRPYR